MDPRTQHASTSTASLLLAASVGAIAALIGVTGPAWVPAAIADQNPATDTVPRVVPYSGTLDVDGIPLTGSVSLRFTIYDGSTAVWSEDVAITATDGRFSALLGASVPIDGAIGAGDDLTLGIVVLNGPGPADDVALVGRQRFVPVPFAMWTAGASDLVVARDAFVQGELQAEGPMRVVGQVTFDARRAGDWVEFSDGQHGDSTTRSFECPANQYVCGVATREFTGDQSDIREVELKCCTVGL